MMKFSTMMWMMMTIMMMSTMNPVKTSMILMFMSVLTFYVMLEMFNSSWFSIIFILLFIGGILIMFMILSSLLPNEKSMKIKPMPMLMLLAMIIIANLNQQMMNWSSMLEIKWFMQSSFTLQFSIMLISSYFLSFLFMLSKSNKPMRSMFCY